MSSRSVVLINQFVRVMSTNSSSSSLRCALIQSRVGKDRAANLTNASRLIGEAKGQGAHVAVMSECFNSPYGTKFFEEYAESVPSGPTSRMLSAQAQTHGMHIIGGTFPEREGGCLYNTCTAWDPQGALVAKYRKMHLFDIDIPGGITFKESEVLASGDEPVTCDIRGVKFGLGICYDLRFEELAKVYRLQGCQVIVELYHVF